MTAARPRQSYLICATPRCGSYLLCEALINTGVAGEPAEYFWRDSEPIWSERWGVNGEAEYVAAALAAGTTPNGVFGAKVMWAYFDEVVAKLRRISPPANQRLATPELLRTFFPQLQYVFITRHDKVRQAVSYWKAIQTQVWVWSTPDAPQPAAEPRYDFRQIDRLVRQIEQQERGWQGYFASAGVEPLAVVYEDLVAEYDATAQNILDFLHVETPASPFQKERQLRKQADAVSEAWVAQYHEQKRRHWWSLR